MHENNVSFVEVYLIIYFLYTKNFLSSFTAQAALGQSSSPEKKIRFSPSSKDSGIDTSFEDDVTINTISPRSQDTDFFSAGEEDADNMMLDAGDHTTVAAGMKVPAATVNSLASRLKSTKITTTKPKRPMPTTFLQISHPSIVTRYQDANRRNWMVNVEVHLLSCTVQEDIEASLELRSDGHYLLLKEKMNLDFSYPDFFERFLPDEMNNKDKASLTLARQDSMMKMHATYTGDNEEGDDENIFMMSSYKLPFVCDDIFAIPEDERYPGTMYEFFSWSIFDAETEDFDETIDIDDNNNNYIETNGQDRQIIDSVDKMKCFVIRLVSKEKNKEKMQKATPKKRGANQSL